MTPDQRERIEHALAVIREACAGIKAYVERTEGKGAP